MLDRSTPFNIVKIRSCSRESATCYASVPHLLCRRSFQSPAACALFSPRDAKHCELGLCCHAVDVDQTVPTACCIGKNTPHCVRLRQLCPLMVMLCCSHQRGAVCRSNDRPASRVAQPLTPRPQGMGLERLPPTNSRRTYPSSVMASSTALAEEATEQDFTWKGSDSFSELDDRKDQTPLPLPHLTESKRVVLVRHGQSTWNAEGRIQGSTDFADLTQKGRDQADITRTTVSRVLSVNCSSSHILLACADSLTRVYTFSMSILTSLLTTQVENLADSANFTFCSC